MKNLLLFCTIMISGYTYSQQYEIGAMNAMGMTVKMGGEIDVQDSMLYITIKTKAGEESSDYDIVNERNRVIYVSDGTETFEVRVAEMYGKRKGFKHSHVMTFAYPNQGTRIYYLKSKI